MLISDFAIRRPIITIVTMLALVVFGIFALLKLRTDEFPDVAPPFVGVSLVYPGASPDIVENEVLDPIEEQIAAISGVKKVNGTAEDNFGFIMIEFQFEKPLQEATQDVRDAISEIASDLPAELEEPIITKLNDTDRPIVSLALTSSTLTPAELTRVADPGISRELRSIPGVAEVAVIGTQERELTVELRPADLQSYQVSVAEVVQALQLQNLAAPVGRVIGDLDERSIRLRGRLERPEEFARIVVSERNGSLVRLGQVATVRDATEEARSLTLFNEVQAVGIDIKKSKGYSTTEVADRILARMDDIERDLPPGAKLELVRNAGTRVTASLRNVQEALFEGAFLTVIVVFLFLNSWRSTVITGLALPVSVLASFIAVWAFGFTLNMMSLLGLSLAIGILIDDAIVVRENIVRHVEMGKDHYTAAQEGTDEIGLAVTATTFSILAVFVPIAFMGGMSGQWFKPFALTMACSVLVSLFVSFSLDPMLSAYWPDPHVAEEKKAWITKKLDRFNAWFNRQAENYKGVIAWALDHPAAMVVIAVGTLVAAFTLPGTGATGFAVVTLGGAVMVAALVMRLSRPVRAAGVALGLAIVAAAFMAPLPVLGKIGVSFFPLDDRSEFYISVETPPGSNLEYSRRKTEEVLRIARAHPEVAYTYATLGGGVSGAVDKGNVYVRLVPMDERDVDAETFAGGLRAEINRLQGVTVAVFTSDFAGGRKQLMFQMTGPDLVSLNAAAEQVLAAAKRVPNAVDVALSTRGQKPEINVDVDRGLAGSLDIAVGQVAQALRPAFAGIDVGDWVDPSGETRDVVVRLTPAARERAADLRQLPLVVRSATGAPTTLPLGQIATVTEGTGPAAINHLNRDLVINVEANVAGRSTGEVTADILAAIAELNLPPGVEVSMGGDIESQQEVFGAIFFALGVAVMLMYLILVMQFGSFLDPFAIMLSLPLSLIGVMLALFMTGTTINIMSLIGVILLAGIVAKNAILLIDFAKWAKEQEGLSTRDALIQAGAIRLRPIVMTTAALVAGMVPVALGAGEGAAFRKPLGIAVIGGVITSTLLTLLVIPTFYELLDRLRDRSLELAKRMFRSKRAAPVTGEYPVVEAG